MADPVVLLLESRADFRALYGLNLYAYLGAKVQVATNLKLALDVLANQEVQLIFVDNNGFEEDMALQLLRSHEELPSICVVGETEAPKDKVYHFGGVVLKDIVRQCAKILEVTAEKMIKKEVPDPFPLPLEMLIPGWLSTTPLTDGEGNIQVGENKVITEELLDDLEASDCSPLFVKKEKRLKFVNGLTGQILRLLDDPEATTQDKMAGASTGMDMVTEQMRSMGVTDSSIELANAVIGTMTDMVRRVPKIQELMAELMNADTSYRYQLSLMISYIGSTLVEAMSWGSEEQQEKIAFIAFFANLPLNKDQYVQVRSDEDYDKYTFKDAEVKLIHTHAITAARLVAKVNRAPMRADTIIKQHHGSNLGEGFGPLHPGVSPLALIYMVAEEWSHMILGGDGSPVPGEKVVEAVSKRYYVKDRLKGGLVPFDRVFPSVKKMTLG